MGFQLAGYSLSALVSKALVAGTWPSAPRRTTRCWAPPAITVATERSASSACGPAAPASAGRRSRRPPARRDPRARRRARPGAGRASPRAGRPRSACSRTGTVSANSSVSKTLACSRSWPAKRSAMRPLVAGQRPLRGGRVGERGDLLDPQPGLEEPGVGPRGGEPRSATGAPIAVTPRSGVSRRTRPARAPRPPRAQRGDLLGLGGRDLHHEHAQCRGRPAAAALRRRRTLPPACAPARRRDRSPPAPPRRVRDAGQLREPRARAARVLARDQLRRRARRAPRRTAAARPQQPAHDVASGAGASPASSTPQPPSSTPPTTAPAAPRKRRRVRLTTRRWSPGSRSRRPGACRCRTRGTSSRRRRR